MRVCLPLPGHSSASTGCTSGSAAPTKAHHSSLCVAYRYPQQEEFASKTLQENSGNFSLLPGCSGNEPSACVSASRSLTEQCAQDPLVEDGPTAGRGCFYWVFLPSSAFLLKLRNRLSLMSRWMNGAPPTPSRWIPVHPPDS